MAVVGLAFGSLGMVGGTVVGGELGPMAVGYSMLIAITALYLVAGLAIRERVWQRLSRPDSTSAARPGRLAGRRVF
jgi:hypothetical protein